MGLGPWGSHIFYLHPYIVAPIGATDIDLILTDLLYDFLK